MDSIKLSDWFKGERFQDSCAEPDKEGVYKGFSVYDILVIIALVGVVDFTLDFLLSELFPFVVNAFEYYK